MSGGPVYQESVVETKDGRQLEVASIGEEFDRVVFFHHGSPGSCVTMKALAPISARAGVRLVTMSRAGYGTSTRAEGRRVVSVVDDVRAVLDAFGVERYVVVGWSGGGPHALACAALDAPRCIAAWSLAGVTPLNVAFDWTEGMGEKNLEEFELARRGGDEYEALVASEAEKFSHATPDNIVELFDGLLSEPDLASLASEESRVELADGVRHAFRVGWGGFYDDDQTFIQPWGFDPTGIKVPVAVWYGDRDLMVPPTHGAWLASEIVSAHAEHFPDEGHLSLIANHLDQLGDDIARAFD